MKKIKSISDVVEYQLCTGCGLCAFVENKRFVMQDTLQYGKRPFLVINPEPETGEALSVCPGITLKREKAISDDIINEMFQGWGNIYRVREGYAADPGIRRNGSSGGIATILAKYCLDKKLVNEVIHTSSNEINPLQNETVLSKSKEDLLRTTGSRYSPASPVEGLVHTFNTEKKYLFIGKPCDVAGIYNYTNKNPEFTERVPYKIAFFCAGTPSTEGNIKFLESKGVTGIAGLKKLKYRGEGWPGRWSVEFATSTGEIQKREDTYASSWGFLQKYRQWRCYICPDHSGEFADISLGDPWYKSIEEDPTGKSLIITRSKKGEDLVKAAIQDGYIIIDKDDPSLLPSSQKNLLFMKGSIWARLNILRLFLVPTPDYKGFSFFRYWFSELTLYDKLQSVYGTIKRIFKKGLNKRIRTKKYEFDN